MVSRMVIAGTDENDFPVASEPDCLDGHGTIELRCAFGKFKFLEIAAGYYEYYSIAALDSETDPIEMCDEVFLLLLSDPNAITPQGIAAALYDMGICLVNNSAKVEARLDPDQINPETGLKFVPMMPLPRMLALQ